MTATDATPATLLEAGARDPERVFAVAEDAAGAVTTVTYAVELARARRTADALAALGVRVCRIKHEHIGTSVGLMLTLPAVGGFFIPIIFGHLVAHASFTFGWEFLAIVTFAFALIGVLGRNPATGPARTTVPIAEEEAAA